MRRRAERDATDRIDGNEGGDAAPVFEHGPGRAEAALQIRRRRARARADGADLDVASGRFAGRATERAIGRREVGRLSPAIVQIEERGGGGDRHPHRPDGEAAPVRGEPVHRAICGGEPEGRPAGQHDSINAFHAVLGTERRGLAARRRAAHHLHRRDRRRVGQEHGDAGLHRGVGRMTDGKPRKCFQPSRFGKSPRRPMRIR